VTVATRAKLGVLAVLATGVVVWLLVHDFVGHAGKKRLAWRDLTAQVGPLRLPYEVSRVFTNRAQIASYLHWTRYKDQPRVPRVDFRKYRLFLVSSGVRTSTTARLKVLRVVEQHGRIVVSLRFHDATLAQPGQAKLNFPYALITLPAGCKPVHLKWYRYSSGSVAAN
jgi:hypothetical protein